MNKLLIIDPQNDFCDVPGAALPVPGAKADLLRLADFIPRIEHILDSITITFDTHPTVAIERPGFWQTDTGAPVAAFTQIRAADVQAGRFVPRTAALMPQVLAYLDALEQGNKYTLMVWPPHCVLGTWGHAMPEELARSVARWEVRTQTAANKVLKGLNPMTEQYSAIRAEVPVPDDARTNWNTDLVKSVSPGSYGFLLIAGEALSHCVRATVLDLFSVFTIGQCVRTILLQDCMSSVPGFEAQAQSFLAHVSSKFDVNIMTTEQAMYMFTGN